ncbi:MAG: hypothetical protein ACTSUG_10760 [Candidatus Helarchaeota archaeon]
MENSRILISKLQLKVEGNCIGFEGIGIGDYYNNFKLRANQLKEAYEYLVSKYPFIENIFLTIVNTIINNNFGPNGIILLSCYYLKYLEDKNIDILNYINELRKHKKDFDYLLSSLSVLKIAFFLTEKNIKIKFPQRKKDQPSPDIIAQKNGIEFKIDVKGRGAIQLKRLAYKCISEIKDPNQQNRWHSFDRGIQYELEKSSLRKIVKDAFLEQKIDILIIDETNNLFQLGGIFLIKKMFNNVKKDKTFSLVKNNLVFCSFFNGSFNCIEINKDSFLKETLPTKIKDKVPRSCVICGENTIKYWKEDKEKVIFQCYKCRAPYIIPFEKYFR